MFALVMAYTGHQRAVHLYNMLLLSAIPLMTVLFVWTNDSHHLVWTHIGLTRFEGINVVKFDRSTWYWVQVGYFWMLFGTCLVILLRAHQLAFGIYRRQIRILLIGLLVPLSFNLIYMFGLVPANLDINPFSIIVTSSAFTWGIFQYEFFDLMPVAYRTMFTSMQDAVLLLDSARRIVDLNPAAQATFGLEPRQIVGKPVSQVLSRWPTLVPAADLFQSVVQIAVNGQDRSFDVRSSALNTPDGKTNGVMLLLHDITKRLRAETALEEANARLDMLRRVDAELSRRLDVRYVAMMALDAAIRFSTADTGFIGLNTDSGVRVIHSMGLSDSKDPNQQLVLNRGITSRVICTCTAELVPDVQADPDYFALIPGMRSQITVPLVSGPKLIGVITLETSDPSRFTTDTLNTIKQLAARVGIAIDNSNIYEEREKLIIDLDAFAHTVAHDLKNPVSILYGYSSLLLEHSGKMSQQHSDQMLNIIAQTSEKMTNIVNELLLLASVRKGVNVKVGPIDMAAVVSEVQARLALMIDDYDAVITAPDHWPQAVGYGPWIEEVWVNYISNAMKYGGVPPHITLGAAEQPDGSIRFWVRDNGPGLTADQKASLFTEFSRLQQVKVEGHGLGLSIVQRIVEKLNGKVGVESVPGEGSTFSFTLPALISEVQPT